LCELASLFRSTHWEVEMRENTERWMELAKLAATEQDPIKMLELVREINELLEKKQKRLNREESEKQGAA
jgi:hypothetical protein